MKLIVAVDKNWGIGREGKLLFHIPADLKFFKEKTLAKTVVMGRKTLDSLPDGKPLQGRRNIVLTRGSSLEYADELTVVHSFEELFRIIDIDNSSDVFLIGGAELYNALLMYCDTLYITEVDSDGHADTFLINIDAHSEFICEDKGEWQEYKGLSYRFCRYGRKVHM